MQADYPSTMYSDFARVTSLTPTLLAGFPALTMNHSVAVGGAHFRFSLSRECEVLMTATCAYEKMESDSSPKTSCNFEECLKVSGVCSCVL